MRVGIRVLDEVLDAVEEAKKIVATGDPKRVLKFAGVIIEEKLEKQGKSGRNIARYRKFFNRLAELLG